MVNDHHEFDDDATAITLYKAKVICAIHPSSNKTFTETLWTDQSESRNLTGIHKRLGAYVQISGWESGEYPCY